MPIMPVVSTLNANSAGIMNAIRDNASSSYYQSVPKVQDTTESIRMAGEQIMGFQPHLNEFVNALVNRIGLVWVTSRRYQSSLKWAKKGQLENGETVEEIFVNAAEGQPYNVDGDISEIYKLYSADVRSAFHTLNMQSVYPVSINENELRLAFLSREGVVDLIARKVEALYSGLEYDEYIMTKYVLARLALEGSIFSKKVDAITDEASAKQNVQDIKSIINKFQFFSTNYNVSGVNNHTPITDLYIITTADFDASNDVQVLASAFNLDKVEFLGRRTMVDSFSFNANEIQRLEKLLKNDTSYTPFTSDDLAALATITAVACDREFFQIWDNTPDKFTENYDGIHLKWNEFLHAWRTYSASPFANVVMFTTSDAPAVTAVTVNGPDTATAESTVVYTASISGSDFANRAVTWAIAAGAGAAGTVTIDQYGRVTIGADGAGAWTITATSVQTPTVSGSKTLTIS